MLRWTNLTKPMTRQQLRKLFSEHYGAALGVSIEIGMSRAAISAWLLGKTGRSPRIEEACQSMALTLVERTRQLNEQRGK